MTPQSAPQDLPEPSTPAEPTTTTQPDQEPAAGSPVTGRLSYASRVHPGGNASSRAGAARAKLVTASAGAVLVVVAVAAAAGYTGGRFAQDTTSSSGAAASAIASSHEAVQSGGHQMPAAGSVADIAGRARESVVQLNVAGKDTQGTGSGFVFNDDGYIVTNNHVATAAGKDTKITVVLPDGTRRDARLVGADAGYDLAVVKIPGSHLRPLPLGDSSSVNVGDPVIAMGSPLGLQGTVTTGIVSSMDRPVTAGQGQDTSYINALQTDAAINPGNSGGPLLNARGAVIGVNSAIAGLGAGAETGSIGLGFAIPVNTVKRLVEEIIATGQVATPRIGVQLSDTQDDDGAKVESVIKGSAAAKAGIRAGDVIVRVGGVRIVDATAAIVAVRAHAPGEVLDIDVQRDGTTLPVHVKLGTSPAVK